MNIDIGLAYPKRLLITVPAVLLVLVFFGPDLNSGRSWLTHFAYHNWNIFVGFWQLHFLVKLIFAAFIIDVVYIAFEPQIRYWTTLRFYSEPAAKEIALRHDAQERALSASQLGRTVDK